MTRQNFLLSGLLLILLTNQGLAQLTQPRRLEIIVKNSDHDFQVVSMGVEGLALIRDLDKYSKGKKRWQLEVVDTALTITWSTEMELDNQLSLVGYEHSPGRLFLLFRDDQTAIHTFQLANILLVDQYFQIDKIQFDLNFRLTHFTVAGNSAIFGGYVNSEPAVLLYNRSSEHPKVLPGLFTKGINLLDVRANQSQSFNVLLVENKRADESNLILRTFDQNGNLLIDDVIQIEPRYTILSGITSTLVHDEMMIAGTFSEGNGKQAVGFYSVSVDPFGEQPVRYWDFGSLGHFLDYLPETKSRKIKNKVLREKAAGRSFSYKANVVLFRMAELSGAFYLFGEMFHPATGVNSNPYGSTAWNNEYGSFPSPGDPYRSGRYNNPMYRPDPPFRTAESRLIQSVVLKFSSPTAAPADISMKLEDIKKPMLEQTSDFLLSKDSVVLAFKKQNEIRYQKESGDPDILPNIATAFVTLSSQEDIFKDENMDGGGMRFWYGSHFYAWGYQRIKKDVNNDSQSRYVFYVNRVDL